MTTSSRQLLQEQLSRGAALDTSQLDVEKIRIEKQVEDDSAKEGSSTLPTAEETTAPPSSTVPGLTEVISRIATRRATVTTPGPPPDVGTRAWLCVFGAHLVVMNTWGVINSFGSFQSHYVEALERSPSDIAWIGSIEIFFLYFISTFTGRLTDAGFFRHVFTAGSTLIVLGAFLTSISTQYWQVFLAQGVCVGLGNGCLFAPAVTIVSTYFQKYQALAIGLAACGSVTGGVVYPSIVQQLLPRVGFGWTIRTIGFLQAGTFIVALLAIKPRTMPRTRGRILDLSAFRELDYTFYALGGFMCFWGIFCFFFFLPAYARDMGLSYTDSLNLLMIMSGVSIIGRLLPNFLADRVGTLTVFIPTAGAGALLMWCWIAIKSPVGLYVWASVTGNALGGIQGIFPSALAALTTDPRQQGTRIGMVFTMVSFAVLTGPPIAGALISATGSHVGAQTFAGSCLLLGTCFVAVSREIKRRKTSAAMWDKL